MNVPLRILICLVGSASCASSGAVRGAGGNVTKWSGSFRPPALASNAVLAPATPNRGMGTITLTSLGGTPAQTRIDLSVNVTTESSSQVAWAVFAGACGAPGPIVAGQNEFPTISVSSNGDGHVRTDVTFTLDPKGAYHANVYWTARVNDMNDIMMCANLQPGR